jgi:hypothetical protein
LSKLLRRKHQNWQNIPKNSSESRFLINEAGKHLMRLSVKVVLKDKCKEDKKFKQKVKNSNVLDNYFSKQIKKSIKFRLLHLIEKQLCFELIEHDLLIQHKT